MKKQLFGILALIVSITFLISLVSCSNKPSGSVDDDAPLVRDDSTGSTSAPENNAGNVPDFSAIMAGNGGTDTVWGMQDPAARQQIIDAAKSVALAKLLLTTTYNRYKSFFLVISQ